MSGNSNRKVIISALLTGVSGIIVQVLLIRELLIVFSGNELTIGIVLSIWVLLEAIGAFLGAKIIDRTKNGILYLINTIFLFSISTLFSFFSLKFLKIVLGIPQSQILNFPTIIISTVIILSISALTHGAIFSFLCAIYKKSSIAYENSTDIFIYETFGTFIGSLILTFFVIRQPTFNILLYNLILNGIIMILLFEKNDGNIKNYSQNSIHRSSLLLMILIIFTIGIFGSDHINKNILKKQYGNVKIITEKNTYFGKVLITEYMEQRNIYYNGDPIFTIPYSDIEFMEEFIHFSVLFKRDLKNVLLIGADGLPLIGELRKYGNDFEIDLLENDVLYLHILRENLKDDISDIKNLNFIMSDKVYYLKNNHKKYDIIFSISGMPDTVSMNNKYTVDFFSHIKKNLSENGIFSCYFEGTSSTVSGELGKINSILYNTLKNIFSSIKIISGDTNYFLCSKNDVFSQENLMAGFDRLEGIESLNVIANKDHINYRFGDRWAGLSENYKNRETPLNRSFYPILLFYTNLFNNVKYYSDAKIFTFIEKLDLKSIILFILSIFAVFFIITKLSLKKHKKRIALQGIIFTTGFSAMSVEIILITAFQIIFGNIYAFVGILIALFMIGSVIGSFAVKKALFSLKNSNSIYFADMILIIFIILLPFILNLLYSSHRIHSVLLMAIFYILCVFYGIIYGLQFPLVVMNLQGENDTKTAGAIYSADLLGGCAGGLIISIFLLSYFGFMTTLLIVTILKITMLVLGSVPNLKKKGNKI